MDAEAITRDELEMALRELSARTGNGDVFYPDLAGHIFGYVKEHREPEYVPGGIYLGPGGACWRRTDDGMWEEPGADSKYSHDFPLRPLQRLVPLPSREDLLAALEESIARGPGYDGQVRRVMKLLDGGGRHG